MDQDQSSRNPNLGLNRLSRPIRKSPPPPQAAHAPAPPHVYNISKNDFRSIVQQLTGTPTRDPANPPPPPRPKPPSMRMQRIRPPPLPSLTRPPIAPPPPVYADSPVTAYMRYLETSLQLTPAASGANYVQPYPSLFPGAAPPSPSGFLNLLSPRSPYPLLSPGFHLPPPLSPSFSFASQGPGLPSPGLRYPMSPSGYFPLLSPRWSDF